MRHAFFNLLSGVPRIVKGVPVTRPYGNARLVAVGLASVLLAGWVSTVTYSVLMAAEETATELYVIGTELIDGGDYPKAIDTLKRAAYLRPSDPRVLQELGNAYYFEGNDSAAVAVWSEAIRLDPSLEQWRLIAASGRPRNKGMKPPSAVVHADPIQVWNRAWTLSILGLSRKSDAISRTR